MDSDTEYTEYRTDVSETDIASPARPGRFKGPKSTWRTFNEDEIALAESLVKLEAQDLSAHLYNTHVMKKSLYDPDLVKEAKPWASKVREIGGIIFFALLTKSRSAGARRRWVMMGRILCRRRGGRRGRLRRRLCPGATGQKTTRSLR